MAQGGREAAVRGERRRGAEIPPARRRSGRNIQLPVEKAEEEKCGEWFVILLFPVRAVVGFGAQDSVHRAFISLVVGWW
jgi:hypothetical protein